MKILAALGSMRLFLLGKTSIFVQMQPDDTKCKQPLILKQSMSYESIM